MPGRTNRVQTLLSPHEAERLQSLAVARGESVQALVRRAVETVYFQDDRAARLQALRELAAMNLPVADWETMERESGAPAASQPLAECLRELRQRRHRR